MQRKRSGKPRSKHATNANVNKRSSKDRKLFDSPAFYLWLTSQLNQRFSRRRRKPFQLAF
jgi:hypothetical protein